jgi:hypothetical protein
MKSEIVYTVVYCTWNNDASPSTLILGDTSFIIVNFNRVNLSSCEPTGCCVRILMEKDSNELHGFEEKGVPKKEIDEEIGHRQSQKPIFL